MKTYHMYHTESISAESKLKEFEKQEEKQIGRTGDPVFNVRLEDKNPRRSFVKKIEKMKEKVLNNTVTDFCGGFSSGYSAALSKSVSENFKYSHYNSSIPMF